MSVAAYLACSYIGDIIVVACKYTELFTSRIIKTIKFLHSIIKKVVSRGKQQSYNTKDVSIGKASSWLAESKKGFASTLCVWIRNPFGMGGQAYYIAPLQPAAFAAVKPWRIHKELAV